MPWPTRVPGRALLLVSACGKSDAPAAAPGGGMPPPEVGVVTVQPGEVGW